MTVNIKQFESEWMGKRVTFARRLERYREGDRATWTPVKEPGAGWVVGVRWPQTGEFGPNAPGPEAVWLWQTEEAFPAALVATGARTKHVLVPLDALEAAGQGGGNV